MYAYTNFYLYAVTVNAKWSYKFEEEWCGSIGKNLDEENMEEML